MANEIKVSIKSGEVQSIATEVKKAAGGVSDYPALTNKPKINGVELDGDKTTEELGIEIPEVPKAVSAFENDSGYLTEHQDISHLATKEELPTIPENVSAFTNDAGYLTEHQDISGKADKADTYTKAEVDGLIPTVPTKTSELTNDSGFITAEDVPETDLTGYLQNKLSGSGSLGVGTYSKVSTGADSNALFFGNNIRVSSDNSLSIGNSSCAGRYGIAIGASANSSGATWGVCIGDSSSASLCSTAVGYQAKATATRAIQLGAGTNSETGTFKVALSTSHTGTPTNYTLLDVNGHIPGERMSLQGTTAPTTATVGSIGQFYVDTASGTGYMCVGVADGVYTWKQITA